MKIKVHASDLFKYYSVVGTTKYVNHAEATLLPTGVELAPISNNTLDRTGTANLDIEPAQYFHNLTPKPATIYATLVRRWTTLDGMYGELTLYSTADDFSINELATYCTVEKLYADNKPFYSAIPLGYYTCQRGMYNRGGYETFEVMNVPGRTEIKIHIANVAAELLGCIGLGLRFGYPYKKYGVVYSKSAHSGFMQYLNGIDNFNLNIDANIPNYGR